MLPGQQQLTLPYTGAERLVAGIARSPLQTGTGNHPHTHDFQRDAELVADSLTVCRPVITSGLQAMMHMDRTNHRQRLTLRQPRQRMQQNGGVETAGERHPPRR